MAKLTSNFRRAALRRGMLVKTSREADTPQNLLYAAAVEFANLGFIVEPKALKGFTERALTEALTDARAVVGADRNMKPIYPGFPKQVQELSTLQLLVEQILHYWTGGAFLPNHPTVVREGLPISDMLRNARELEVLPAAATARKLTEKLVTDPVALSDDDKTLLRGAVELQHVTLDEIQRIAKLSKNGENLQTFVSLVHELQTFGPDELLLAVVPNTRNADQLLRTVLVVASEPSAPKWAANYSTATENLADRNARAVKMLKISRTARRAVIERLGEVTAEFYADKLVTRQELWRRVLRAVHPYDFVLNEAQRRAADIIHSNVEYRTFNSLVEEAIADGKVKKAAKLLGKHQPGNLLRRVVALLRLVKSDADAQVLADVLRESSSDAALTTLISAYNGVLSANDSHARVTRVAGLTNTMVDRSTVVTVKKKHLKLVLSAIKDAMAVTLSKKPAPTGAVAVVSDVPVPLVRRDASTADRVLDRGQEIGLVGSGDVLRIFGHWNNNLRASGYMDIGVVILDKDFNQIAVSTWNTWSNERTWSTYSGDKLVSPGDSAPEFIDINMPKLRKKYPAAKWAAMTVQSWSGWPINTVDFIAGAMLRSDAQKGEVFDPRSLTTAFKPTAESTQAVPFAVNLETGSIVWVDSSNGSTASGVSSSNDGTIGSIVYDEIARPRFTFGDLAEVWSKAHNASIVTKPADREALLELLK